MFIKLMLITGCVFGSVVLFCYSFLAKIQHNRLLENRLRLAMAAKDQEIEAPDESDQTKSSSNLLKPILTRISRYLGLKSSQGLTLALAQADLDFTAGEFLVLNIALGIGPGFLLFWGFSFVTVIALALIALLAPSLYLNFRGRRRSKKIGLQLPEALITIANSLKAGHSFLQALDLVSRETDPPIAQEFAVVIKEMNLGAATEMALQNMVERVNSDDMDLVITAVLIQRQVGGNLAEILESIAATIRERIRIKGEINTLTAQGRISGLVIGALPIVLGVLLFAINPDYIRPLFAETLGRLMLGIGVFGQILAVIIISKIVNIQV